MLQVERLLISWYFSYFICGYGAEDENVDFTLIFSSKNHNNTRHMNELSGRHEIFRRNDNQRYNKFIDYDFHLVVPL